MNQRLFIFLLTILTGVNAAWAQHTEIYDFGDGVKTYNVVYLNLSSGNNSKAGDTRENAVKTWAAAYSKLPAYTGTTDADRDAAWDHNIIVVCDATGIINIQDANTGNRPATITGTWPWTADNTMYAKVITGGGVVVDNGNSSTARLGADTKFKYIRFNGTSAKVGYLCMYLHDTMFDVGCIMEDFVDLSTANGATSGRKAPDMEVFMYANTYNFDQSKTDGGWPAQTKPVTLTIKSGKFGRILTSRITGTTDAYCKQRYVIANPDHPLMAIVNIDIDPTTTIGTWNPKNYADDIAFLCSGMTQGIEYCDVQYNIKRAKIATFVGAMQGMSIAQTANVGLSNSSFFGRTETNLIPENDDDVVIQRYFAACLGRSQNGQNGMVNAAFYGHSTLNMHGGKIMSGAYVSAGGISGLQSPDGNYHTTDQYIPYLDNTAAYSKYPYMGIRYQPYDTEKTIAKVTTTLKGVTETIDLAETVTQMNIYGGVINGGLYGGSYGYSTEMEVAKTIAGAGSLWGETNVNIYGGHIYGGVYGGGEGSSNYYNLATAANRDKFTTVATVYGNTNVNIYGGNIEDGIFGGGKGLVSQAAGQSVTITTTNGTERVNTNVTTIENEFADIAKVYGTTNVTIDPKILKDRALWTDSEVPEFTGPNESWTFTGDIYGGGALGSVEGNTNVIIKGGIITGNVFGAGEGEDGHPDKAKVTGNTNVTVGEEPAEP